MTRVNDFTQLPTGSAPKPLPLPHFPDTLHAVIWRNWDVIALPRLAAVLRGEPEQIAQIAESMGLPPQREITDQEMRRNYMTILHRNWHLLPYEQLCGLLGWDAKTMHFALHEDDFMYVKLGGYKPDCAPVYYAKPDEAAALRAREIRRVVNEEMGGALAPQEEPPFGFIKRFRECAQPPAAAGERPFRMVYPYFLRFGDPLLGDGVADIPEGYLAELSACGVSAIWLQGVLNTLAPWELAPELSMGWEERLKNLNLLVQRCQRFGIEVVLYLNEPRGLPRSFFEKYPELRGVEETPERASYSPDVVALCVSTPAVQDFLVNSVRHVFEHVPDLGGIMAITFSENLTNCYSREYGSVAADEFALRSNVDKNDAPKVAKACPRCETHGPEVINARVCTLLERGMRLAGSNGKFLFYAWSTPEAWMPGIIERLPESTWLLCISEFGVPFTRGDYSGKVNEYSISVVGPSDQSIKRWEMGAARGLKTAAKMQVANTFELSSVPYIPALRLVAQHLSNVTRAGVNGLMLGWTAGGSPSPNLEITTKYGPMSNPDVKEAMRAVAVKRFGGDVAEGVVKAWDIFSDAYSEFPFDINVCYNGPQSLGPANLLFAEPTGFVATMVTFPFDDLDGWRGPYSVETLQNQFQKVVELWKPGVQLLDDLRKSHPSDALDEEWRIAEACRIHFQSTVNQIRFIRVRQQDKREASVILREEIALARRLYDLVGQDSRIGFEATNHYGYIGIDLVEKILNCRHLLTHYEE